MLEHEVLPLLQQGRSAVPEERELEHDDIVRCEQALFAAHVADPAAPCVVVPGGPTLSYGDLDAASARYANALVRAGCRPEDRAAVQVDKHWQVLPLYLACLRARLVYLPLNTGYRRGELAYFFGDATRLNTPGQEPTHQPRLTNGG